MTKVAVVTGGSRGIGFGTAEHLASRGWDLAICSRNAVDLAESVRHLRTRYGAKIVGTLADISRLDQMTQFADVVKDQLGPVSLLIGNAAVLGPVGELAHLDPETVFEAFGVNVHGFVNTYKAFWTSLVSAGDFRIIALAGGGLGGPSPLLRVPAYVPSKAALVSLIEVISLEVEAAGGTINAIAPGNIPTEFMKSVLATDRQTAGEELYLQAAEREGQGIGDSMRRFIDLLDYVVLPDSRHINGRLLSARWNEPSSLEQLRSTEFSRDLFRLRRVDNDLYFGK